MTKITEEMVDRALRAFWHTPADLRDDSVVLIHLRRTARKALEAALSEPEEIPVTDKMIEAGRIAGHLQDTGLRFERIPAIYRAMRRVEMEENPIQSTQKPRTYASCCDTMRMEPCPMGAAYCMVNADWRALGPHRHRRSTDPHP